MSASIPRILGRIATARGRSNEARALEACAAGRRPPWMRGVRKATLAEDHDGIDLVVESDVGKLYVQVKSSRGGKAAFLQKRRRAEVAVVVVKSGDTDEAILRKIVAALQPVRAGYLRERGVERGAAT
jgi:hypothetical protein